MRTYADVVELGIHAGLRFLWPQGCGGSSPLVRTRYARLAQLVEHPLDVGRVIGSSPIPRTMKSQFTIGTFGIIFDKQKRVLLCHRRDYDLWNLPGGAMESGESPWDGVKREIKEETGLVIEVSKLAGVYSKPDKNEIVFSFICNSIGGEITLN